MSEEGFPAGAKIGAQVRDDAVVAVGNRLGRRPYGPVDVGDIQELSGVPPFDDRKPRPLDPPFDHESHIEEHNRNSEADEHMEARIVLAADQQRHAP